MKAYSLEYLQARGWKRQPAIYWTEEDARRTGMRFIRNKSARAVHVYRLEISEEPIFALPEKKELADISTGGAL